MVLTAYLLLLLAAIGGGVLFFGFSLVPRYPHAVVLAHMAIAGLAAGCYAAAFFGTGAGQNALARPVLGVATASTIITFLLGAAFYLRFDLRGLRLRSRLLAIHLVFASTALTAATAALPLYLGGHGAKRSGSSTVWDAVKSHRILEERYEARHGGRSTLPDESDKPGEP